MNALANTAPLAANATVQRLEDERLAQVQASATIARGGV